MTGLIKQWSGTEWVEQETPLTRDLYNVNTIAASGASVTLPATVDAHDVTMTANCTFTFTSPTKDGHAFLLVVRGAFTPTFPGAVVWSEGYNAYVDASMYGFMTFDGGTTWLGSRFSGAFG